MPFGGFSTSLVRGLIRLRPVSPPALIAADSRSGTSPGGDPMAACSPLLPVLYWHRWDAAAGKEELSGAEAAGPRWAQGTLDAQMVRGLLSQLPPPKYALLPLWQQTHGWSTPGMGSFATQGRSTGCPWGPARLPRVIRGVLEVSRVSPRPHFGELSAAPLHGPPATRRRSALPLSAGRGVARVS